MRSRGRDTRAACAEHAPDKFMCHYEFTRVGGVVCRQYQTGKTLLHGMMLGASDRLADHRQKHLRIVEQKRLERTAETNFGTAALRISFAMLHPESVPRLCRA